MIRTYQSFPVKDIENTKHKMLSWANRFNICCFMDNHGYASPYHTAECLMAAGAVEVLKEDGTDPTLLDDFYRNNNDWIFGHFNYEYRPCQIYHGKQDGFPPMLLFVPEVVVQLNDHELSIGSIKGDSREIFQSIIAESPSVSQASPSVQITPRLSKDEYIAVIEKLLEHIHRGDCYEINFCQEFYAEGVRLDPQMLYRQLTALSPNPFASFYKIEHHYLLCASPERYLKKTGNQILSQPIKGTLPRVANSAVADNENVIALYSSEKDRSENVMVVDLVRNDLSRICRPGSVEVTELFGVYTFPQVYQMISSIAGILKDDLPFSNILSATFPMGSMTGAPKQRVMDLIEQYEVSKRGIYSGTVGYITPGKDFDFNVVIRSLVYDRQGGSLSYHVGSGITAQSVPEGEYEECLSKAAAINQVVKQMPPVVPAAL